MTDLHGNAKRAAARVAADFVQSGMRLGLGTGSTFVFVLERLAERRRECGLEFVGVATSEATTQQARELGIPLATLDEFDELDLAIDGADEVDPAKNLIKGGGGALVREKIVAAAARELVVIVGANKLVSRLGETFRLPVECMRFGARQVERALRGLELVPTLRRRADGSEYESDNGNRIFDCTISGTPDPELLERAINGIPGVVDNGLFVGMTGRVVIGDADGSVRTI